MRFYAEVHGPRSFRWRPYKRRSVLAASTMRRLFEEQGTLWNLSWSSWRFSGARHRFPSSRYFSAAVPITINIVPTNTAIATPEYNMP